MIEIIIAAVATCAIVLVFRYRLQKNRAALKQAMHLQKLEEMMEEKHPIEEMERAEKSANPPRNASELDFAEINRTYRIADMHFARGDFDEAEKWFVKVVALHPQHAEALNRLGVIYIQQGNPRRAEIIYRKLFAITQKEPVYYCNYGRCLYNQGRRKEAVEAYENAIKLDSTKAARFSSAGQIYYEEKDYAKALAYFVRALELEPQNIDYLRLTAELAEETGDAERAHRSLKKILAIDPYNEEAKKKLGKIEKNKKLDANPLNKQI